jgi:hypothetical protein
LEETQSLALFVQQNALNIDRIFPNNDFSKLYLKMLTAFATK